MTWSEAVHWVHWLWGLPGVAGLGQLLLMSCLGPPSRSYKVICRWLILVLGLEVPRRVQAANQGWLLLVLVLSHLVRDMGHEGQMLLVWEILEKSEA